MDENLDKVIRSLEEQMYKVAPGSEEQRRIAESLERLYKVRLEEEKNNASYEEMSSRMNAMEVEAEEKRKNAVITLIFRGVEVVAGIVGGVVTFVFYNSVFHETLDFEERGTPSSNSFRTIYRHISDFFSKRRKR